MFNLTLSTVLARLIVLLIAFPVHEAAHAWAAFRLGDDTAKRLGRMTLNPLVHLDPVGSIMLLVAMIGWAKPVPVNPSRLQYGPRVGNAMVAAAGPFSNLLMATLGAVLWRWANLETTPGPAQMLVFTFVEINILLFLFNMIPLAPLDGFSVLGGLVGERMAEAMQPLRIYGPFLLMGVIMIGYVAPAFDILGRFIFPAMNGLMQFLLGY